MSILEQLRQKQQAAGLVADPETGAPVALNPEWESAPGRFPGLEKDAFKPLNVGPEPKRGYCRIFPASFASLAAVPQSFKDEFWRSSSPWCKIDGEPEHPQFAENLAAIENV